MINYIFGFFIIVGIIYSFITSNLNSMTNIILKSSKNAFDMVLKLFPLIALWGGIMRIAEKSGLLKKISKGILPVLTKIFPEIPKDHVSLQYISSNIIANIFGLGNIATPFGIKAMKSMQELNHKKDTASNSMITFLVINTTGLTLIPTTVIGLRMAYNSSNPSSIIITSILATITATAVGLVANNFIIKSRKKRGSK